MPTPPTPKEMNEIKTCIHCGTKVPRRMMVCSVADYEDFLCSFFCLQEYLGKKNPKFKEGAD